MPQMMPINWMMSFTFFIVIFILFNIFNYYIFSFNNKNNITNKKYQKKTFIYWKW